MRKDWTRLALAIPTGLVSGIFAAAGVLLVGSAVFWLYLYGDDTWPTRAENILVAIAFGSGALTFIGVVVSLWPRHGS